MKKTAKIFCIILTICVIGISMTACEVEVPIGNWFAPMLSFTASNGTANLYNGTIAVERANDTNAGIFTGQVTTAGITEAILLEKGAVKATAKLNYSGDEEFLVRFRVLIDEFVNHSVTTRRLGNATGDNKDKILVLWKDTNGTWWDIRRTQIGNATTGGVRNPFVLQDGSWAYESDGGVISIKLNKNTISQYESIDLYILVQEAPVMPATINIGTSAAPNVVPFVIADHLEVCGYIVTYYVEVPDRYAGHFHGYEILASASTAIAVPVAGE
jgi:hypothetical protein